MAENEKKSQQERPAPHGGKSDERMMMISLAILVLSLSVLVVRIASDRFPGRSQD